MATCAFHLRYKETNFVFREIYTESDDMIVEPNNSFEAYKDNKSKYSCPIFI